jgi:ferrous iron transport protein A
LNNVFVQDLTPAHYATTGTLLWNNSDTVEIHPAMPSTTLATLSTGDIATIVSIHAEEALHQRLLALGFRSGKQIEMIRKASFSGPLQVRIGTTDILLRRSEAAKIAVCKS